MIEVLVVASINTALKVCVIVALSFWSGPEDSGLCHQNPFLMRLGGWSTKLEHVLATPSLTLRHSCRWVKAVSGCGQV